MHDAQYIANIILLFMLLKSVNIFSDFQELYEHHCMYNDRFQKAILPYIISILWLGTLPEIGITNNQ